MQPPGASSLLSVRGACALKAIDNFRKNHQSTPCLAPEWINVVTGAMPSPGDRPVAMSTLRRDPGRRKSDLRMPADHRLCGGASRPPPIIGSRRADQRARMTDHLQMVQAALSARSAR